MGGQRDLDALLKLANQHAADAVIHTMKPRFRRLCDQQPLPKRVWRSLVLQEKVCARVASRLYNHNRVVHEVAEETTALCCNQGTVHAQLVYAPAPSWVTTVRACMRCCYRQQCASLLCLRETQQCTGYQIIVVQIASITANCLLARADPAEDLQEPCWQTIDTATAATGAQPLCTPDKFAAYLLVLFFNKASDGLDVPQDLTKTNPLKDELLSQVHQSGLLQRLPLLLETTADAMAARMQSHTPAASHDNGNSSSSSSSASSTQQRLQYEQQQRGRRHFLRLPA